jgi:hypothetical protein
MKAKKREKPIREQVIDILQDLLKRTRGENRRKAEEYLAILER